MVIRFASLVLIALLGLPAATSGGYVDVALERDQDVPAAWDDAVAALDAGSSEYRVLQLPGSEFGAFRWGYTLRQPVGDKVYEVQFDDWMYLMNDRVMLNKAVMSKFGIRLGEVTLSFVKRPS